MQLAQDRQIRLEHDTVNDLRVYGGQQLEMMCTEYENVLEKADEIKL